MSSRAGDGGRRCVGLDVGGANLKLAVAEGRRAPRLLRAETHPFQLWRAPADLPDRLAALAARHPAGRVALTMTGELADCYPDRKSGVEAILGATRSAWPHAELRVLCVDGEWREPGSVRADPRRAAAANWRAPAAVLARRHDTVLLADMGSTTTDLVPIRHGRIGSGARTDLERLRAGELVYTGLLRTPVAALVKEIPAADGAPALPLAAERFAITADARLWLGHIASDEYGAETPDGGPASRPAAGRRLARMACSDAEELGSDGIDRIARAVAAAQGRTIRRALDRQRARLDLPGRVCATGAGASVLKVILRDAGLEVIDTPPELDGRFAAASTAAAAALTCPPSPAGVGADGHERP